MHSLWRVFFWFTFLISVHTCVSRAVYNCVEDFCKKDDSNSASGFESREDCRLSCGTYGAIWPHPTGNISLSPERVHFKSFNMYFTLHSTNLSNDVTQLLYDNRVIFQKNLKHEQRDFFRRRSFHDCIEDCKVNTENEIHVNITVKSSSMILDWSTDESYTLSVNSSGSNTAVLIRSATVYGARHGLETLSNLITISRKGGFLLVSNAFVQDRPRFSHRGVMLDTARHFIPLTNIYNILDAMAAAKMNVFHWHAVDSHSFPLEISRVPQMHSHGSYSPKEVYSVQQRSAVISYARKRGIRVLIEIDGPAHSANGWQWGPQTGLGNLTVCTKKEENCESCYLLTGQLNPVNDHIFDLLGEIYEELASVNSPEETIHMGGDEVDLGCWNNTREITDKMQEMGMNLTYEDFLSLWSMYHNRSLKAWDDRSKLQNAEVDTKKPVIVWSSDLTAANIIEQYLPKERFIVQSWADSFSPMVPFLLRLGYRVIESTLDAWYFDHGFWGNTQYYRWDTVYNNRIRDHENMLGGEVCMWTEFVDKNVVESRIWPRAGAAAERLWSNPSTSAKEAKYRFYNFRERLMARGINADVVTPEWCVLNEGEC